jgi:hypothetical protein
MSHKKEFIVFGIVEGYQCNAVGRCCDIPIRVGDHFGALFRYKSPQSLEDYAREPVREGEARTISLQVKSIQSYGKPLSHLSPGMTGTLELSGTGCNLLAPGWVLGVSDEGGIETLARRA